jgi:hypothetical protein
MNIAGRRHDYFFRRKLQKITKIFICVREKKPVFTLFRRNSQSCVMSRSMSAGMSTAILSVDRNQVSGVLKSCCAFQLFSLGLVYLVHNFWVYGLFSTTGFSPYRYQLAPTEANASFLRFSVSCTVPGVTFSKSAVVPPFFLPVFYKVFHVLGHFSNMW